MVLEKNSRVKIKKYSQTRFFLQDTTYCIGFINITRKLEQDSRNEYVSIHTIMKHTTRIIKTEIFKI